MGLERRDGWWLWIGGPVAPGADATTIWTLVLVRRSAADDPLLIAHELEHVAQWRRHGVPGFVVRYLRAYLRWRLRGYPHWSAYRRIPLEIEAEWTARRRCGVGTGVAADALDGLPHGATAPVAERLDDPRAAPVAASAAPLDLVPPPA
ncbi:MAG: hypothetical protein JWN46_3372 [Acidimicrobiales bacterium]|nr:hypothetical protein [Acidimicrobiales bacterium]